MSRSVEFSLGGRENVGRLLRAMGERGLRAAAKSLNESGEIIMSESKEVYCPVETGALRSTGRVEVEIDGEEVALQLSYGGPAAPYAAAVHEVDRNYNFGKQWKYLETPFKEKSGDAIRKLAQDIASEWARGTGT